MHEIFATADLLYTRIEGHLTSIIAAAEKKEVEKKDHLYYRLVSGLFQVQVWFNFFFRVWYTFTLRYLSQCVREAKKPVIFCCSLIFYLSGLIKCKFNEQAYRLFCGALLGWLSYDNASGYLLLNYRKYSDAVYDLITHVMYKQHPSQWLPLWRNECVDISQIKVIINGNRLKWD